MQTDKKVSEIGGDFNTGHTQGNALPPEAMLSEHYQGEIKKPKITLPR